MGLKPCAWPPKFLPLVQGSRCMCWKVVAPWQPGYGKTPDRLWGEVPRGQVAMGCRRFCPITHLPMLAVHAHRPSSHAEGSRVFSLILTPGESARHSSLRCRAEDRYWNDRVMWPERSEHLSRVPGPSSGSQTFWSQAGDCRGGTSSLFISLHLPKLCTWR